MEVFKILTSRHRMVPHIMPWLLTSMSFLIQYWHIWYCKVWAIELLVPVYQMPRCHRRL